MARSTCGTVPPSFTSCTSFTSFTSFTLVPSFAVFTTLTAFAFIAAGQRQEVQLEHLVLLRPVRVVRKLRVHDRSQNGGEHK